MRFESSQCYTLFNEVSFTGTTEPIPGIIDLPNLKPKAKLPKGNKENKVTYETYSDSEEEQTSANKVNKQLKNRHELLIKIKMMAFRAKCNVISFIKKSSQSPIKTLIGKILTF